MPDELSPKEASDPTRAANAAVRRRLPFDDTSDFDRARRGLLAPPPSGKLPTPEATSWDLDAFAFLDGEAPATVNPSLWRQGQLNNIAGLFEVEPGFFQVRGYDISNITFIEGENGWIVIDPLTTKETAGAAVDLVTKHLGKRPVTAVIYTHSHADHFGGVRGVIDEADVAVGNVPIIAPEGFLEAAISENVIAGNVMLRRASYMYGPLLPRGPKGHVDAGLGKTTPLGTTGLIAPTESIAETGSELTIDGVRIVFQLTPGTEAPAEMNFFFPDRRVLCMAENCSANLHNVYTPRGAQVRDALAWSTYMNESIEWFARDTDTLFASHHWPRWGQDDVHTFLTKQRDTYRYLHDQTMRLANHGLTMVEIAEEMELPHELGDEFFNRDYYGTVNHNAKAVYQRYIGWFDGNPANLHQLPPQEASRRYVDYMGGADEVLRRARDAFDAGDYRWVAEVVNRVVFAEPENRAARLLQADTLEQLGYQAESGPWRSFYLTAAQELRHGTPAGLGPIRIVSPDVAAAMTVEMLLEYVGVRLNGPRAAGLRIILNLTIIDDDERWVLGLENGAVHTVRGRHADDASATVSLTRATLAAIVTGADTLADQIDTGTVRIDGDRSGLDDLISLLDTFELWFDIVTP